MPETSDSSTGIDWNAEAAPPPAQQPFAHCVAGLHIGAMSPRPVEGEFDAILTLARDAGHVPDLVRHRHIPLSYANMGLSGLGEAVEWVLSQLSSDRKILIRSEAGRQRPGLVVGAVVISMGGTYMDAVGCVRHGRIGALTDFRYLGLLKQFDQAMRSQGRAW